jgi:hypothetical protein
VSDEPIEMRGWPLRVALGVLALATAVTAVIAEILVGSIEEFAHGAGLSDFFVAAVVVAIVGFVIASSGGDGEKPAPPVKIVVRGGKPVGGVKDLSVNKGDPVRFTVVSDVTDEIHVHGYDFHKDVKKGGSVTFDFPAKIDGEFVIELESRGEQIASLKVQP